MRSILLIAAGSLLAFLAGLAGTYFVMPVVAPDFVEAERVRADSLARLDSLALAGALPMPDSLAVADSLARLDSPNAEGDAALRDSLTTLKRRLADYEAQVSNYEVRARTATARRTQAADLASTLVKLEDRELARILGNLDLDVLEILYAESTARNRARLLGALDPERAAAFVRRAASSAPVPRLAAEPEPAESGPDASTPR
jgi:hypothetical protein